MLLVWFGIMQMFNPASSTIVYGILGVKLFFWYIPLYFVGYALLNSEADLRRFFRVNTWLALIITGLGQREVIRVFRTVQRAALAIGLAVVALFFVFPDALFARLAIYSETLTPGSSASELQNRTWDYPLSNFLGAFNYDRWPYGFGIGTSSLGVQYVAKFFHGAPMGLGVESGFGALVVEMGIGGLILWLVMSIAILVSAWKVVKKLKGSAWFAIGFSIFLYAFVLLIPTTFASMQAYEDFVINAYCWTLLGILFRLPSLALSSQFANVPAPAGNPRLRPR
jgi:hypothetical protein